MPQSHRIHTCLRFKAFNQLQRNRSRRNSVLFVLSKVMNGRRKQRQIRSRGHFVVHLESQNPPIHQGTLPFCVACEQLRTVRQHTITSIPSVPAKTQEQYRMLKNIHSSYDMVTLEARGSRKQTHLDHNLHLSPQNADN